jgi:DNA mismatch repair protein MutS2
MMDNSFPDDGYVDINRFMSKIRMDGGYLEPLELAALRTALDTVRRITAFFRRNDSGKYPFLNALTSGVNTMPAVSERIDSLIDRYGQIKDNASPELQNIRREKHVKQNSVSRRMQSALKAAQNSGIVDPEAGITMRDGHAVIPVSTENKRKLKGLLLGESATGRTVFIEPFEVVELNNEIRELEFAEQREIIAILLAVAAFLRMYADDIQGVGELLADIDFIRAKARYAIEIDATMPLICDTPHINLRQAKHPLLMRTLKKENKEPVPLDLTLDREHRILLISGPNAGGKSVCIKTVGLLQYMLQCGFLVPTLENSEIGLFKNIFIDIGDEQSIENDLSTYSSHLTSMKYFLRHSTPESLTLIDEFGTGTEPAAGGAIAEAVLANLLQKGAFGLITTHYSNLKYFASSADGIVNGAMMFDTQRIMPLFKLEMGIPGSSFAFEIARKIGLPEDVLKNAEEKMGSKQAGIERSLREIARDRRYWEDKRTRIRKTDKHLEELTEKYEKELRELHETRRKLIADAKEEARRILAGVNKEIENTIRTIRESQADKAKTKAARQRLDEMKAAVLNTDSADASSVNDIVERQMNRVQERRKRREEKRNAASAGVAGNEIPASGNENENETSEEKALVIGDKVKVKGHALPGEIMKISDKNIAVAIGNLIVNVKPDRIERISRQAYRQAVKKEIKPSTTGSAMSMRRLNFKPYIDVRGCRTPDAIERVTELVDEAMVLGVNEVSILHGKGNGILKDEIRKYLYSCYGKLLLFSDASEESGGAGITLVVLVLSSE